MSKSLVREHAVQPVMRDYGGGQRRRHARVECTGCGLAGEIPTSHGVFNPEKSIQRFVALGWEVDIHHRRTRCPLCVATRREKRMGEKPNKTATVAPMTSDAPRTTQLTPDQKAAVRRLLDTHFDDQRGHYLDGYSDQRVADEVNVPRALVSALRDNAYAPLREPSELERLRDEIEATRTRHAGEVSAMATRHASEIDALRTRVEDLARKLTGAA